MPHEMFLVPLIVGYTAWTRNPRRPLVMENEALTETSDRAQDQITSCSLVLAIFSVGRYVPEVQLVVPVCLFHE